MTTTHIQIGQYPPVDISGLALVCFNDWPTVSLTLGFLKGPPMTFTAKELATDTDIKDAARRLGGV
jgi:hypothetical protein